MAWGEGKIGLCHLAHALPLAGILRIQITRQAFQSWLSPRMSVVVQGDSNSPSLGSEPSILDQTRRWDYSVCSVSHSSSSRAARRNVSLFHLVDLFESSDIRSTIHSRARLLLRANVSGNSKIHSTRDIQSTNIYFDNCNWEFKVWDYFIKKRDLFCLPQSLV